MKAWSKSWLAATSICLAVAGAAGCASYVGHIRVSALKQQVNEGLACPASELTITCSAKRDESAEACGGVAEVVGCGHRSRWVLHEGVGEGHWVMTSLDGERSDE
jgi:hypothetical protein